MTKTRCEDGCNYRINLKESLLICSDCSRVKAVKINNEGLSYFKDLIK